MVSVPRKKKIDDDLASAEGLASAGVTETETEVEPIDGFDVSQVVVFRLAEQTYALPIGSVQEIQQIVEFTPVPGGSPALVGMIDLRGAVVAAIDLRLLLGFPARGYGLDTPMILFHTRGRLVALLVDQVEDVAFLPEGCMQPPSNLYALADRIIGICKLETGLVVVFDPDKLVPDAALSMAEEME